MWWRPGKPLRKVTLSFSDLLLPCISLQTHQQRLYWQLNPAFPYTDKHDAVESSLGIEHFSQYNLQEQTRGSHTYSGRVLNIGLTDKPSEAGWTVPVLHYMPVIGMCFTPYIGNMPEWQCLSTVRGGWEASVCPLDCCCGRQEGLEPFPSPSTGWSPEHKHCTVTHIP